MTDHQVVMKMVSCRHGYSFRGDWSCPYCEHRLIRLAAGIHDRLSEIQLIIDQLPEGSTDLAGLTSVRENAASPTRDTSQHEHDSQVQSNELSSASNQISRRSSLSDEKEEPLETRRQETSILFSIRGDGRGLRAIISSIEQKFSVLFRLKGIHDVGAYRQSYQFEATHANIHYINKLTINILIKKRNFGIMMEESVNPNSHWLIAVDFDDPNALKVLLKKLDEIKKILDKNGRDQKRTMCIIACFVNEENLATDLLVLHTLLLGWCLLALQERHQNLDVHWLLLDSKERSPDLINEIFEAAFEEMMIPPSFSVRHLKSSPRARGLDAFSASTSRLIELKEEELRSALKILESWETSSFTLDTLKEFLSSTSIAAFRLHQLDLKEVEERPGVTFLEESQHQLMSRLFDCHSRLDELMTSNTTFQLMAIILVLQWLLESTGSRMLPWVVMLLSRESIWNRIIKILKEQVIILIIKHLISTSRSKTRLIPVAKAARVTASRLFESLESEFILILMSRNF